MATAATARVIRRHGAGDAIRAGRRIARIVVGGAPTSERQQHAPYNVVIVHRLVRSSMLPRLGKRRDHSERSNKVDKEVQCPRGARRLFPTGTSA